MRGAVWLPAVVLGLAFGPAAHSASPSLLDGDPTKIAIHRLRKPSPPFCVMHNDPCRQRKMNICAMARCERRRPTFCFMEESRCDLLRARAARRAGDRAAWAHHLERMLHGREVRGIP